MDFVSDRITELTSGKGLSVWNGFRRKPGRRSELELILGKRASSYISKASVMFRLPLSS